jgi:hypothetical protein
VVGQEVVHGSHVDPAGIVADLVSVEEVALHLDNSKSGST